MIARSFRLALILAATWSCLGAAQQRAIAGSWLFKPSLDGGPHLWEYQHDDSDYSHLSDTAPATPHPRNVAYSITLRNPTKWTIAYALNDKTEPRLKPGESAKWTIMGSRENPARFTVRFDNGQKKNITYRLENNTDFVFEDRGAGVDLYKRRK